MKYQHVSLAGFQIYADIAKWVDGNTSWFQKHNLDGLELHSAPRADGGVDHFVASEVLTQEANSPWFTELPLLHESLDSSRNALQKMRDTLYHMGVPVGSIGIYALGQINPSRPETP